MTTFNEHTFCLHGIRGGFRLTALIKRHGGKVQISCNDACDWLVTTEDELNANKAFKIKVW